MKAAARLVLAVALLFVAILVTSFAQAKPSPPAVTRLHCALNGVTVADWRTTASGSRVKLDGEWSEVSADAVGPMIVLLWAGGASCKKV